MKGSNLRGDERMNGTVTYFYGRALTGQGEKQLYRELMEEAREVIFFVGAFGVLASKLLRELGYFFVRQGEDIEWFLDPLQEDIVEALFVRELGMLYIHDKEGMPRPKYIGSSHQVVSFYECYHEEKIGESGDRLLELTTQSRVWREKVFAMMEIAKDLHDEWEIINQQGMDWGALDDYRQRLETDLFGTLKLRKEGRITHRLLGTLTPLGARDTVQNMTKDLERRLFIKGYPGTGKSSFMKGIAVAAMERGFEARLVWCGLDSNSVDMIIVPELSFCIFDSTEPHLYFPEDNREGDEIIDIAQYCQLTDKQEEQATKVASAYKEAIILAKSYVQQYAERIVQERKIFDDAVNKSAWDQKAAHLFQKV